MKWPPLEPYEFGVGGKITDALLDPDVGKNSAGPLDPGVGV